MRFLPRNRMHDIFDDFFDDDFLTPHTNAMLCDVRETDHDYILNFAMPGFKKDDIKIALDNGYLTVTAEASKNDDEKNKEGKLVRQERYHGTLKRSFYVGDDYKNEDIKAAFDNGELKVTLVKEPKHEEKKNYIDIG